MLALGYLEDRVPPLPSRLQFSLQLNLGARFESRRRANKEIKAHLCFSFQDESSGDFDERRYLIPQYKAIDLLN